MSIKKRGDMWHVDIQAPDGQRIRRSTGTIDKRKALEYHDKLKAELWDIVRVNKKPERLFQEAVILFLKDAKGQAALLLRNIKTAWLYTVCFLPNLPEQDKMKFYN